MRIQKIRRWPWVLLLGLALVTGCTTAEPAISHSDSSAAVFSMNRRTGPRDLPKVPELPASPAPGATFTLDGMCSGTATNDDQTVLSCARDPYAGSWTYNVTTQVANQFSGVDNYPTEDFYSLSVVAHDEPRLEGKEEWTAQVVVAFADSTGQYVQMAAPDSDSVRVRFTDDHTAVAFSMINAAVDKRSEGSPTTAAGTIICPP